MKKSGLILGVLLAMAMVFSGMVFGDEGCQTYSGSEIFTITNVTNVMNDDLIIDRGIGIGDRGQVAWIETNYDLSYNYGDDIYKIFVWSEAGGKILADSYAENFYVTQLYMSPSGALVYSWVIDEDPETNGTVSVMFNPESSERHRVDFFESRQVVILGVDNDSSGLVYVIGHTGGEMKLWIVSTKGVEHETTIDNGWRSGSWDNVGGLHIDRQTGEIYVVVPTLIHYGNSRMEFVVVYDIEMAGYSAYKKFDSYILGWDGNYLPTIRCSGISGDLLVGQWDGQPFTYNLKTLELLKFPVCAGAGTTKAKGIFLDDWLIGNASATIFFQNLRDDEMRGLISLPFYSSVRAVGKDSMIISGDSGSVSNLYQLKLK
jgi:hypothetical protein